MTELITIAKRILSEYYLCKWCLGRLFGGLSTGLSNKERGEIIIEYIKMDIHYKIICGERIPRKLLTNIISYYRDRKFIDLMKKYNLNIRYKHIQDKKCYICGDLFGKIDWIAEKIYRETSKYDFNTFQVGIQQIPEVEGREEEIKRKFGIWFGENIRNELSREIGKALAHIFNEKNLDREYVSKSPDIIIVVDLVKDEIVVSSRYLEVVMETIRYESETPIFSMNCPNCKGNGCDACYGTGREIGRSFEAVIGLRLLEFFGGERWKFGIQYIDKDRGYFKAKFKIINPKKRRGSSDLQGVLAKIARENGFKLVSINIVQ